MFHQERLKDPRKLGTKWTCPESMAKGSTVFVCSMADLFGEWVPTRWIWDVFEAMDKAPRHTFIMLTKNPKRMASFAPESGDQPRGIQENWWFGATITSPADIHRISLLKQVPQGHTFISFEPLLEDPGRIDITGIEQVIIGAQTNPDKCAGLEAVLKICEAADRAGAKVFMKDSLAGRWPDRELRRELCWSVKK